MSRRKKAPNPPVAKELARLTYEEIEAAKTPAGGWTRAQLHAWGIPWPPENGWMEKLTGQPKPQSANRGDGMVTIIADASFSHHTKDGGWAAWVKAGPSPGEFFSGGLKTAPTSVEAEMMAMAYGLRKAVAARLVRTGATVMLQSDCAAAIGIIQGLVPGVTQSVGSDHSIYVPPARRVSPSVRASAAVSLLKREAETHRLKIVVRHVRGHIRLDESGRTNINRRCDALAKRAAKEMRAEKETA